MPEPAEDRVVETRYGRTHALVAGPASAPPLVVLHGAITSSAHVLGQLGRLAKERRVYAIDIVGQSVWSEDRRIDVDGDSYGHWLMEACTALGLREFDLIGVSYGGYVALRGALVDSARVRHLMLLCPGGFVSSGVWAGLRDAGLAVLVYRMFPTSQRLERVMHAQFTTLDPHWVEYFGQALLSYRMDLELPGIVPDDELKKLRCPLLVLGAEFDVHYPGTKLLARIRRLLPHAETDLLRGWKHCPPLDERFREQMADRVERFSGTGPRPAMPGARPDGELSD